MKNICAGILTATLLFNTAVHAGGMAEPMMAPEVIVEEASASSGGYLVPLLILAALVAIASGSGGAAPAACVACD